MDVWTPDGLGIWSKINFWYECKDEEFVVDEEFTHPFKFERISTSVVAGVFSSRLPLKSRP